jgi:hypothetical protein
MRFLFANAEQFEKQQKCHFIIVNILHCSAWAMQIWMYNCEESFQIKSLWSVQHKQICYISASYAHIISKGKIRFIELRISIVGSIQY